MNRWLRQARWHSMIRWWIVGVAFTIVGLGVLYIFTDLLHIPLMLGTLVAAEVTLLVRFLINDRWVFNHPHPTWTRLVQFHIASAGGGAVWWMVSNVLPRFGVHYLIAAVAGTACSVFFGMSTNFFWIWRQRGKSASEQPETEQNANATARD